MFAEYALLIFKLLQLAVAHMVRKQAVQERREERRGWKMDKHHHNTRLRAENVRISRFLSMGLPFRCLTQLENQREVP
jgi:hypothetical protein